PYCLAAKYCGRRAAGDGGEHCALHPLARARETFRRNAGLRRPAGGGHPQHRRVAGEPAMSRTEGGPAADAYARDKNAGWPVGPPDPRQEDPAFRKAQEERLRETWAAPEGWRYWSAVNNTEVGVWYTATAFGFMLFAGVLALMMRVQLAMPENDFLSADLYNQAYTLHGTVMMFLFAVPIFEAVAILLLPQMLGARDLPFPRLSAFGYWCFVIGGVFVCGSIFFGEAPTSGWFMYPPLTTQERFTPGYGSDIWLLGLSFIEVASLAAAVELIVGTLKCRPPGMRINQMPLYAWYVLVVGGMILFAF